jgi:hypothetical protein
MPKQFPGYFSNLQHTKNTLGGANTWTADGSSGCDRDVAAKPLRFAWALFHFKLGKFN